MIKSIKANFYKDIHNMQTGSTQLMPPLYRTTPDYSVSNMRRNTSSKICDSIDIKQLLLALSIDIINCYWHNRLILSLILT